MLKRSYHPAHRRRGTKPARHDVRISAIEGQVSALCWELERLRRLRNQASNGDPFAIPDEVLRWGVELRAVSWPHTVFFGKGKTDA